MILSECKNIKKYWHSANTYGLKKNLEDSSEDFASFCIEALLRGRSVVFKTMLIDFIHKRSEMGIPKQVQVEDILNMGIFNDPLKALAVEEYLEGLGSTRTAIAVKLIVRAGMSKKEAAEFVGIHPTSINHHIRKLRERFDESY